MVEFQPFGPKLPHDPEGTLEHERDVHEEAEQVHDVKRPRKPRSLGGRSGDAPAGRPAQARSEPNRTVGYRSPSRSIPTSTARRVRSSSRSIRSSPKVRVLGFP